MHSNMESIKIHKKQQLCRRRQATIKASKFPKRAMSGKATSGKETSGKAKSGLPPEFSKGRLHQLHSREEQISPSSTCKNVVHFDFESPTQTCSPALSQVAPSKVQAGGRELEADSYYQRVSSRASVGEFVPELVPESQCKRTDARKLVPESQCQRCRKLVLELVLETLQQRARKTALTTAI